MMNAPRFAHFGHLDAAYNMRGTSSACPYLPKLGQLRVGDIVSADDVAPLLARRRLDWHRDYAAAQDCEHVLMSVLNKGAGVFGVFFVGRRGVDGDFTTAERTKLRGVLPHLRRAAGIGGRLSAYGALARQNHSLLESLTTGILRVDGDGAAHCVNGAAESAVARSCGLRLSGKRLTALDESANRLLQNLIASAMAGGPGGSLAVSSNMDGGLPCVVRVTPLRGRIHDAAGATSRRSVAVFIGGGTGGGAELDGALADFYHLTQGETRVVELLAAGHGIGGAARALDLSENTVKMHAKRCFEKLGVASQAQLARLIASLSAPGVVREAGNAA